MILIQRVICIAHRSMLCYAIYVYNATSNNNSVISWSWVI